MENIIKRDPFLNTPFPVENQEFPFCIPLYIKRFKISPNLRGNDEANSEVEREVERRGHAAGVTPDCRCSR